MLLLLWQYDAAFSHTLKDKNLEVNKYIIKTNPKKLYYSAPSSIVVQLLSYAAKW